MEILVPKYDTPILYQRLEVTCGQPYKRSELSTQAECICEDEFVYPKMMSPKADFVFKNLFGIEENKEYLIAFLNAILQLP